ncbi:LysM peptidoglycan-binding domain-containing protein [Cellulomonas sp. DKR-3]|uniref:LysM peptidoglycan-binding domain-containing protein n=1 Tax=Cellulomonas fulva TaxID=2835530 RepID=A0ABS5U332_9CELL|nr:LysM peptidoglycan-binding domain-containing protein [Cellulomonas fulva]MBT0995807.1 LysM peptidoglycan-binding domain-containing protein [Cellulomonas fulva]
MSAMVIGPAIGRGTAAHGSRPERARQAQTRGAQARAQVPAGGELRLTARGRALLVVLALVAVAAAFFAGARASAADDAAPNVDRYVVQSGETLWGIAESSRAAGESVAEQVRELVRVNGLSGSQVMAGQELVVPRG